MQRTQKSRAPDFGVILLEGMNLLEEKTLDFGDLQLVQKKCHCKHGKVFYQFDNFKNYQAFWAHPTSSLILAVITPLLTLHE